MCSMYTLCPAISVESCENLSNLDLEEMQSEWSETKETNLQLDIKCWEGVAGYLRRTEFILKRQYQYIIIQAAF